MKRSVILVRKICLFFDGTANDHDSQTHVRHLYELISASNSDDVISYYDTERKRNAYENVIKCVIQIKKSRIDCANCY